ncbi:conjugative transposon protein TraM [Arachidicoccus ginsenosidimutans]|uniref:conjugative transposon protein TraM n=1 Tax=Arachidicoccus sp. BS20 TaxID=1850526 RepID=UPI0007F0F5F3|nr:conjugative transposon protein TraM [Arachidicoccus sp. BS20]ANI90112.1 conjugative transposon protein TraM [Arachidicoccus sp. BS20]
MHELNVQLKRQRRFLLVLPVIIVPFLTFFLWSVGIVGKADAKTIKNNKQTGFNVHLPVATQAKDSNWNKMQYYAQADKDSAKLRSFINSYGNDSSAVSGVAVNTDPKEKLIEDKIAALNKKLHEPAKVSPENSSYDNEIPDPPPAQKQAALERMQELQAWSNSSSKTSNVSDTEQSDPELEKLDGMLNKVLDIQHPERVQQQLQQQSEQNKKQVFPVLTKENKAAISLLQNTGQQNVQDTTNKQLTVSTNNRFYGLNDDASSNTVTNTIAAEIPEEQVLVNGAIVKLRLLNDVYIRGTLIPKNQLLYGTANLKGERLTIEISSIGYNGQILPVALSVYDMDGQQGLYIPGAITRDVAKQSADQGIETMNLGTYDASLGAQAASAGIQAAKTLIGKKIKLVKVTVRAGYRVMLKDMNDKDK